MSISKQLLLVTITIFGLHCQINASEYNPEKENNAIRFAGQLLNKNNRTAEEISVGQWINQRLLNRDSTTNQLMDITNSDETDQTKLAEILRLKENEENPKGYFSRMSTFATAAAALVLTIGIASYLYFMRPWSTSAQ